MQIVCFWFESSPVLFGICAIAIGRRPLIILLWLFVAAVAFVIRIAVLIWAIFIVIVCHRTWCLWTCMWYRCTIFVHLRMIRMLNTENCHEQKKECIGCWVLTSRFCNSLTSNVSCFCFFSISSSFWALSPSSGCGPGRVREIIGASMIKRCSCATVDSCGNSMAGARNMYENG